MQQYEWYMLNFYFNQLWYLESRISDKTCDVKYDKSKASITALASAERVLLTTHHRVLDFQTIGDTTIFSSKKDHMPSSATPI